MKDLLSAKYPATLVEKITGVDLTSQRNWIARELYGSGELIEPALAGRPRMFPLLAVYETMGLARTQADGLDLSLFASAMRFRIEQEGIAELRKAQPGAVIAYWEGELLQAAAEKLVEFVETPKTDHYFWIVRYEASATGRRVRKIDVAKRSKIPPALGVIEDIDATNALAHLAFNITAIVSAVDRALQKEGIA